MEPTIYKPGAYKSPGIYKGAGGIYKGRGVYNCGGDPVIPKDRIYETHFKNFSDNKDYPIIGNIANYPNLSVVQQSVDGQTKNFLMENYLFSTNDVQVNSSYNFGPKITISKNNFSVEVLFRYTTNAGDFNSAFCGFISNENAFGSNCFIMTGKYPTGGQAQYGPICGNYNTCTINTDIARRGDYWLFLTIKEMQNKVQNDGDSGYFKYKIQYDIANKVLEIFINDVLVCTNTNYTTYFSGTIWPRGYIRKNGLVLYYTDLIVEEWE